MKPLNDRESYHQAFVMHLISYLIPTCDVEMFVNHQQNKNRNYDMEWNSIDVDDEHCCLVWRSNASWESIATPGLSDDSCFLKQQQHVVFIDVTFSSSNGGRFSMILGSLLPQGDYFQNEFGCDELFRYAEQNNLILGPNDTQPNVMAEYISKAISNPKNSIIYDFNDNLTKLCVKLLTSDDKGNIHDGIDILTFDNDEARTTSEWHIGWRCMQMMKRFDQNNFVQNRKAREPLKSFHFIQKLVIFIEANPEVTTPQTTDNNQKRQDTPQTKIQTKQKKKKSIDICSNSLIQVKEGVRKIHKRRGKVKIGTQT